MEWILTVAAFQVWLVERVGTLTRAFLTQILTVISGLLHLMMSCGIVYWELVRQSWRSDGLDLSYGFSVRCIKDTE